MRAMIIALAFGAVGWLAPVVASPAMVVVARIAIPAASAETIERDLAIPLEQSVEKLPGVAKLSIRCTDGSFLMEVHFAGPPGAEELTRVAKAIAEFRRNTPVPIAEPHLAIDRASML